MDMDEWSVVEAKFDKDDSALVRVYCTWNCKDGGNYVMDVWIVNNEYYGEL